MRDGARLGVKNNVTDLRSSKTTKSVNTYKTKLEYQFLNAKAIGNVQRPSASYGRSKSLSS